jgi:hypothetical protein
VTDEARDKRASGTAFKTLDEIAPSDQPEAGGKAFNCAPLKHATEVLENGERVRLDATAGQLYRIRN